MTTVNAIPDFVAGERNPEEIERAISTLIRSALGQAGNGVPWDLSQYTGTGWANTLSSADTTNGRAAKIISQNATYELNVSNAGMNIVGAPTLDAFTVGSIPYVGASKVLSEENANLSYTAASDLLTAANLRVNTKAGIGGATGTETLVVTGTQQVTQRLGVGGAADATIVALITGTLKSTGNFTVGADKFVVTATTGATAIAGDTTVGSGFSVTVSTGAVASGPLTVTGTAAVSGDFAVATNKFVVTASTGATVIAGPIVNDTNVFVTDTTNNRVGILNATPIATVDIAGVTRITGSSSPASGAGMELHYAAGTALIFCFDRSGSVYKPLDIYATETRILGDGSAIFRVSSSGVGFYGTAPQNKPTVSGSRGGNAALADLLTELATLGLLTDSSSA